MPPFKRKFVPSSTKQRGDDEVEKIDVANEEKVSLIEDHVFFKIYDLF